MNNCTERDIQEMLPDLLHGKLDADARAQVEAHVASCAECREELEVLRTVKSAAVFIPAIDVDRVVSQISPYRMPVPERRVPARSRAVAWLVAASLAVVVAGGGSVLLIQQKRADQPAVAIHDSRTRQAPVGPETTAQGILKSGVLLQPRVDTELAHPHALALATAVDGLSDSNLRQLMNDLNSFDALPATEPGPAISVDNSDSLDQGSR